jgi:hypothetical protein
LKSCFVDGGSFLCIFQDKDRAKAWELYKAIKLDLIFSFGGGTRV